MHYFHLYLFKWICAITKSRRVENGITPFTFKFLPLVKHYKCRYLRAQSFSSVQSLSHIRFFATPWIAARPASLPSPSPGVHSNSPPSSRWCHLAISSSVVPFSSCPLPVSLYFSFFLNLFIEINWRLITLKYCSGFCQTSTWISHGHTWVPHPEPSSSVSCCKLSLIPVTLIKSTQNSEWLRVSLVLELNLSLWRPWIQWHHPL